VPPTDENSPYYLAPKEPFWFQLKDAFKNMPAAMKELWWVKFFTWYSLPLMWQYLSIAIAYRCFHTSDPSSAGFAEGVKWGNLGLAVFNVLCFSFSALLPKLSQQYAPKNVHAAALALGGCGFISMLFLQNPYFFMISMAFVGIAWASIMSTPYVMLSTSVPPHKMGVFMGIFNMFIVIPQILNMLTVPLFYKHLLSNNPVNALGLAGFLLLIAALFSLKLKVGDAAIKNL
jgi:maltose/moltooligosaccharide transporter